MTENKICPFMYSGFMEPCIEDQCMAWRLKVPEESMKGDSWEALISLIEIDRGYPREMAEEFCKSYAKGHCKLIEDRP